MKMKKLKWMRARILPGICNVIALGLLSASFGFGEDEQGAAKFGWDLINVEGHDYVTVGQIKEFYHFPIMENKGSDVVSLRHARTIFEIDVSEQWFSVNNVRIKPCLPIRKDENGDLRISTIDLTKNVEPTLRPQEIKADGKENLKIGVVVTKDNGLEAPIESDNPTDRNAQIFLHLESGKLSVRTEILPPLGVTVDGKDDSDREKLSGNEFDELNVAIAVSCHANILFELKPEDLGIIRSLDPELKAAEVPAARITLSLPDQFDDWGLVSEIIDGAIERLQLATAKKISAN